MTVEIPLLRKSLAGILLTTHLDVFRNVFLSCLLCFFTGSLYALGVFSTSVEDAANPSGSLDDVWSSGMGILSAFSIPSMFFAGVFLSPEPASNDLDRGGISMTNRVRLVAAGGSLSYAFLALGGYGVSISNSLLIQLSFVSIGLGFGISEFAVNSFFSFGTIKLVRLTSISSLIYFVVYLQAMELLGVWVPERPGLAIGMGQMMFGFGSIVCSSAFEYLEQNYSISYALYIATAILTIPTAIAAPFLQWPQFNSLEPAVGGEFDPLLKQATPLSWKDLAYLPSFWMYLTTIFCLQSGYAFIAYYFKIGQSFGKDTSTLVTSYQMATILATLSRPLTGALVDIFKGEGFFSLGSKNMILNLLLLQMFSFMALVPVSWKESFEGFSFFSGIILVVFAAGSCCAPLLAREQFGSVNSSIVYGTGGSISMGFGEIVAVMLMIAVERPSKMDSPSAYQNFYILSLLWSAFGLVVCMLLKQHSYDDNARSRSIEDPNILPQRLL